MDAQNPKAVARYIPSSVQKIKVEPSDPMADINCQNSQDLSQNPANLQQKSNQQTILTRNPAKRSKDPENASFKFKQLISVIAPHLDKDKSLDLWSLYMKSWRNEVPRKEFLSRMKEIVGDQIMKMVYYHLRTQGKAGAQIPYSASEIKVESSDPMTGINGKISQANKSQGVNYRPENFTILSITDHLVTESQYRVTTQSSGNLEQASNQQLAEAQADMSRHIPSSAPEVKVESSDPISGINCQNSQGLQNLAIQSQRVQSFPIQYQRVASYRCSKSQNLNMNQNPANIQQGFHQQTISTQNPTNKSEESTVSFVQLYSMIEPQLDMYKTLQLQTLFIKLRRNEVSKQTSLKLMKEIVGDSIIRMVLCQLQTQADVSHQIPSSAREVKVESSDPVAEINCQNVEGHISQGLHNLAVQPQRIQNSPSQSERTPNHQFFKSENPIANQNQANLQQTSHQHTTSTQKTTNKSQKAKQVSFGKLIPFILPQLDRVKSMQVQTLYDKFRRNEFSKERFARLVKEIVCVPILETAIYQLQTQAKTEGESSKLPQLSSQFCQKPSTSKQTMSTGIATNKSNNNEQVNIGQLIPMIKSEPDEDKNMQLRILWDSMVNEVSNLDMIYFLIKETMGEPKKRWP